MDEHSVHSGHSRLSSLSAGGAVAIIGLLVGLSVAFATGTQTRQYAETADVVGASETVLTASAVARADVGVVLVLARSADGGLEVPDLEASVTELESTVESMAIAVDTWLARVAGPQPTAEAALLAVADSMNATAEAIRSGDVGLAEQVAVDKVLPDLDRLNEIMAAERNEAASTLAALRSSAGTIARLASLGVALIVPAVALFVFRAAMRRRQRNTQLQLELHQERELVRTKDEFVANLSHELRTPLTGIFGFAMVLDDMLDQGPEQLDFGVISETTDVILSEAGELNRMVDDLLTAAKKEGGSLKLVLEDLDIGTAVESSIDLFRRQGHHISVDFEPATMNIDRHHLNQLIRNLVSNATKHGGPNIAVEGRIVDGGYQVHVLDDGDGVPDELVERLFSRFVHQGETPLTTGSVGLGLFIAGMLAETMGGELTYQRIDDISVFSFTIPRQAAAEAPPVNPEVTSVEDAA